MRSTFDDAYVKVAVAKELASTSLGTTQQFLEVHQVRKVQGKPVIANVIEEDDSIIAYLSVEGERFHFALRLKKRSLIPTFSWSQEYVRITYFAESEEVGAEQLAKVTKLKPTSMASKGASVLSTSVKLKFSFIKIVTSDEPNSFDRKLNELLTLLESDRDGIRRLSEVSKTGIDVVIDYHNENGMLAGPEIDIETIKRLAELNLALGFRLVLSGNLYK